MSAEPRRRQPEGKSVGKIVLPRAVEDKSLIHTVTSIFQDVVPNAYGSVASETKEKILWARFEQTDMNDPIFYSDVIESAVNPPLLLVLGYSYGVQVWSISSNGEATELLSWFHGAAKIFKLLPSPSMNQNQKTDLFAHERPLAAICDTGSFPHFSIINFLSLRSGDKVKSIKFSTPVLEFAVNRISVVVSVLEKIAIFDAVNLEPRRKITTCYASTGLVSNPIALGARWLAYSEQKLIPWLKSAGGSEFEGTQSYTATVLNAAKSLSQGIRDLGGSVASTLSGSLSTSPSSMSPYLLSLSGRNDPINSVNTGSSSGDVVQPGLVTVIDLQSEISEDDSERKNGIVAHFVAHGEPIVAMCFDPTGMLLLTADKKGHRFHLFRIQPHLLGSSYTSVHHIYVLHRGDTTARVQDMTFSIDSRWVAVTTLRGTTHVFPVTPYGGPIGLRTHSTPHTVNKLSQFHRSAGIVSDGRNSPDMLPLSSSPTSVSCQNPCLPPFPHPIVITALAQIRSQSVISQSRHTSTQALDESSLPSLKVVACFAPARTLDGLLTGRAPKLCQKPKTTVDSLFIMSSHGTLIQYDLEPVVSMSIPKDKLSDDSPIELKVETKVGWNLLQTPPLSSSSTVPLDEGNLLLSTYPSMKTEIMKIAAEERLNRNDEDDKWPSEVEITTHIGPARYIWMGPQFTFKPSHKDGSNDTDASWDSNITYTAKSNPVNMPMAKNTITRVPLFIESGSSSSLEQSPRLIDGLYEGDSDSSFGMEELSIEKDIADAMMESPSVVVRNELSDLEIVEDVPEKLSGKKSRRANRKKRR